MGIQVPNENFKFDLNVVAASHDIERDHDFDLHIVLGVDSERDINLGFIQFYRRGILSNDSLPMDFEFFPKETVIDDGKIKKIRAFTLPDNFIDISVEGSGKLIELEVNLGGEDFPQKILKGSNLRLKK